MRFSTVISTGIAMLPALASANLAARQSNDPQTSLTLDPNVIASGFANNGQDVPTAGQVASLTSTNNFINFCLTVPNLPITNGKQITTGSCNPAPIGVIPSSANMPSAKFTNPKNGDTIPANAAFTISMAIQNMETGNFVNAQENYFAAPQQLNGQGQIIGHSHVVVETLQSLTQTTPTNPQQFAFFKGLNAAAVNGVLTADVTAGLPAGAYRLCSINTAANHQPAIVPIAQHGSLDDCVYFTASASAAGAGTAAASTVAAAAGTAAASTTAAAAGAAAASTTAAATGKKAGGKAGGKAGAKAASITAAAGTAAASTTAAAAGTAAASTTAAGTQATSTAATGKKVGGKAGAKAASITAVAGTNATSTAVAGAASTTAAGATVAAAAGAKAGGKAASAKAAGTKATSAAAAGANAASTTNAATPSASAAAGKKFGGRLGARYARARLAREER